MPRRTAADHARAPSIVLSLVLHLLLAAGLAACSGGSTTTTGAAAPTAADSALLSYAPAAGEGQWRVWDPARPDLTVAQVQADTLLPVRRRQADAASRSWTDGAAVQLVFLRAGQVFRLDLRGGRPHQPLPLSGLAGVCAIERVQALDAAGERAVVGVRAAANPAACFDAYAHHLLHTGMDAASAAVPGSLVAVLEGDDAQASGVLVSSGRPGAAGRLTLLGPALAPAGTLQGPQEHPALRWLGLDPAQPGLGYFHDGAALRALAWRAGAAQVSEPLVAMAEAPKAWSASPQALWVATPRGQLVRAQGGQARTVADLALAEGRLAALAATPTQVLASVCVNRDADPLPQCRIQAMPAAGGRWTVRYADRPQVDSVTLLGAVGERALLRHDSGYFFDLRGFGAYTRSGLRLLGADGSAGELLAQQAAVPVWSARQAIGQAPVLAGALDCSAELCQGGDLLYRPLGAAAQPLGPWVGAGASRPQAPQPLIEGLAGQLRRHFAQGQPAPQTYTLTPGSAGSLSLLP